MVLLKPGSANARNEQQAAISAVIYEKQTSEELGKLLYDLSSSDLNLLPSDFARANVRDALRDYTLTIRKSKEMTIKDAELEGKGYESWLAARKASNYSDFVPTLKEIIDLKKEIAAVSYPELSSYDGNVDIFERGMRTKRLNEIFAAAKSDIVPLIQRITSSKVFKEYEIPEPLKGGPVWEVEKQKALCAEIAEKIGFDFNKGRFDVSVHPFTGGSHPTDIRITTRYSPENWIEGVSGTVHEVGHALYEQGRNSEYDNTPVSRALSMGVHESQSLFWERMIFQSKEFWVWATPILHKHFPHTSTCTPDDLYKFVNQVEPGLIRIEADEVTYPLHIILRFEIEQGLFDGSIDINNLSNIWNKKIKESLNIDVPNDAKGVLQDIHWSGGAFGYFPSYSLGAMIAAQLFETAEKEIPDLRVKISKGEFHILREWLRKKIHEKGSLYASFDELLVSSTGRPLDPNIYIRYLENKYKKLYYLE
eukprot:gene19725-25653_t